MKALLLDWDGTLYDSAKFWKDLPYRYLQSRNIQADENLAKTIESMTVSESVLYLQKQYDSNITKEDLLAFMEREYTKSVSFFPGVQEGLRQAYQQGILIFIVTISEETLIQNILNQYHLSDWIEKIYAGSKDTPRLYEDLIQEYSLDKKDCLVIDDNAKVIDMLHENGWITELCKDSIKIDKIIKNHL